jgi:hypothetical protein
MKYSFSKIPSKKRRPQKTAKQKHNYLILKVLHGFYAPEHKKTCSPTYKFCPKHVLQHKKTFKNMFYNIDKW